MIRLEIENANLKQKIIEQENKNEIQEINFSEKQKQLKQKFKQKLEIMDRKN